MRPGDFTVRLIFRDPIGRVIVDMTTRPGTRYQLGAGMPSNMLAVGWVDVLEPGQALPDPPGTPGAAVTCGARPECSEVCYHVREGRRACEIYRPAAIPAWPANGRLYHHWAGAPPMHGPTLADGTFTSSAGSVTS